MSSFESDYNTRRQLTGALSDLAPGLEAAFSADTARMAINKAFGIINNWKYKPDADALFEALFANPSNSMQTLMQRLKPGAALPAIADIMLNPRFQVHGVGQDELDLCKQDFANRILVAEIAREKGEFPAKTAARGIESRGGSYRDSALNRGDIGHEGR